MILTVQPPAYFAPVEACARLLTAEVVIEAEGFRFSRKEAVHRAAIRAGAGVQWLSVPVLSPGHPGARISELAIDLPADIDLFSYLLAILVCDLDPPLIGPGDIIDARMTIRASSHKCLDDLLISDIDNNGYRQLHCNVHWNSDLAY